MSYAEYIKSDAWRARKAAYYVSHPKVCSACGSTNNIHLHHRTYARMTKEIDADLVPLCEPCHVTVHKYHRQIKGLSLEKATAKIIAYMGGIPPAKTGPKPRKGKRPMSPSTKNLVKKFERAGRSDPVNDALAILREKRRLRNR